MFYKVTPIKRFERTLKFIKENIPVNSRILDLGIKNEFSEVLLKNNYDVTNTSGEDLDIDYEIAKLEKFDAITALEIFEHMVCPFNLLRSIKANVLIASVPLKLWFAKAYWGEGEWDRHYHEFEERQFNMLLDKAGWEIIKSEKWTSASNKIGIRPILRKFTPRYYIVYCKKK